LALLVLHFVGLLSFITAEQYIPPARKSPFGILLIFLACGDILPWQILKGNTNERVWNTTRINVEMESVKKLQRRDF
jgi:hypothetical protein